MASNARVIIAGDTHVGMKRNHNEDNFELIEDQHLFAVADGMGGHASGEVASKMALETLKSFFDATKDDPEATWPYKMDKSKGYEENRLITGIKLANLRIFECQQADPKKAKMGTTFVSLAIIDEGVLVAHVGDSRVYRLRGKELEQLTDDHSLLNDYIKMRKLTEEEIKNFPHKNIIVRALGMTDTVKVDTRLDKPQPGDLYLLCSDGLCGPVTDQEIQQIMIDNIEPKVAVQKLIEKANENGGPDNITAVIVKWIGQG